MTLPQNQRECRRHEGPPGDQRKPLERDRDRILYSSAFRRLAGVTQVVMPREGQAFHNRLTHSIKVAQVARRLAQRLNRELGITEDVVHPEACEAAGLAHDLGHPPFGHVAEDELDQLTRSHGDGFSGNAQSFRILTKLTVHRESYPGLNLARATLAAVLKYPILGRRKEPDLRPSQQRHFGAYVSEKEDYGFATWHTPKPSLEAQVMDLSDDITYSVHDLEDFTRNGLIPLDRMMDPREFIRFMKKWKADKPKLFDDWDNAGQIAVDMRGLVMSLGYTGSVESRARLRAFTSERIDSYVRSATVEKEADRLTLKIPNEYRIEMQFLMRLVKVYVIQDERLATQQEGVRKIIRGLHKHYSDSLRDPKKRYLLPARFRDGIEDHPDEPTIQRITADIVSFFTDQEAVDMFGRISGTSIGSVHDMVHL